MIVGLSAKQLLINGLNWLVVRRLSVLSREDRYFDVDWVGVRSSIPRKNRVPYCKYILRRAINRQVKKSGKARRTVFHAY